MNYEEISPELKEKALKCETTDELIELAKSEGVELSTEELDGIAGGDWNCGDCSNDCSDVSHHCCSGATRSQGTLGIM